MLACLASAATLLYAQQFKFHLEQLAAKASNSVDLNISGGTLKFAARFLDSGDPDEVKVKKLINGLEGIYIKTFEFKTPGVWSQADLESIRTQLHAPEWERIVGYKSAEDGETDDIYVRTENKKITGVAIIACEPKSLAVVNIAGPVNLDSLAELGGHFGVPKLEKRPAARARRKGATKSSSAWKVRSPKAAHSRSRSAPFRWTRSSAAHAGRWRHLCRRERKSHGCNYRGMARGLHAHARLEHLRQRQA